MVSFTISYNRGNALLNAKDNAEAVKAYGSAIEAWEGAVKQGDTSIPTEMVSMCLTNLGTAYTRLGLVDEALRAFNRSLEIRPTFLMALYNKASLLDNANRIEEAIEAWESYLQLAQTNSRERDSIPEAQRHLSLLKARNVMQKHDIPTIRTSEEMSAQREPNSTMVNGGDEAVVGRQHYLENAEGHYKLGVVYDKQGKLCHFSRY